MAQHTEDHDMVDTNTSQPVNLALRSSTSNAPSNNKPTTTSSTADSDSDDDASTSDSDSEEDASEGEEQIPTLKPGTKPDFSSARRIASGAPSLEDRLKAFLPQLAEANSKLQKGGEGEYSMEFVGEDEPHIEMDLGLGVLEETKGGSESENESDEGDEESGEGEGERKSKKEKDVMAELMGKKENVTAGIEEVG
ncbi:hypothetical protein MBLNU13_g00445t1 [Cladosporium sp. NU13]